MNRLAAILPATNVLLAVEATSKKRAFEHAGGYETLTTLNIDLETVPVACEAFQSRPASSAKTRAPPGDGRRG